MATFVSLLRGINVTGRRIPMADLRVLYERLGMTEVRTYLQSGNVAFASRQPRGRLSALLQDGILEEFGHEVPVVIRTPSELVRVLARNPIPESAREPRAMLVTFLHSAQGRKALAALANPGGGPDRFERRGKEIYLYCPSGYGQTKLSNSFFEKQLGVAATTRNWRTVAALSEL